MSNYDNLKLELKVLNKFQYLLCSTRVKKFNRKQLPIITQKENIYKTKYRKT